MRMALVIAMGVAFAAAQPCAAQTPALTFGYRGPTDATVIAIGANGTLTMPATPVGSTTIIQFYITNTGISPVQVQGVASANPTFSVFPASLSIQANQSGVLTISFQPKAAGSASGAMTFSTGDGTAFSFTLTGISVAADFVLSYLLNPDGNQTPVSGGGVLVFKTTPVSQTNTASFVVANRGTGPGTVSAVTLSGAGFRISGLPLLPAQVPPGAALQFTVIFAPTQNELYEGSLQLTIGGAIQGIRLTGEGASAAYSYELISAETRTTIAPNSTIPFGQTQLNMPLSVTIQIQNTGNAAGTVGSVSVVGAGFAAANLVPLPAALPAGAVMAFDLTFTPTAPGTVAARLIIDGVTFNLSGTGVGAQLGMRFSVGSSTTAVANNGVANFPNAVVGTTVSGSIDIQNTGNAAATINNVSLSGRYFAVTAPALPARIDPAGTLSLPVSFTPGALGVLTSTLGIDTQVITLRGIGAAPPDLPAYTFTGVGATAAAAEQPSVGLMLADTYDTEITGTLTLTFTPDSFVTDPAIQFATGGGVAVFRIPAKTKTAIFSTGGTAVQFQTGTVAGMITITPAFLTGQVSITPASPAVRTVQIASSAPVIRNLQIGTRTANSFEVLISGYSTPRAVTQITLQFAPAAGGNLQTTSLALNAESAFTSWYQTAASNTVGSQFTASMMITVSGNIGAVQAVSATATNAKGTSGPSNLAPIQ